MKKLGYVWLSIACAFASLGCGNDEDDAAQQSTSLELIGEWQSTFGDMIFPESITADAWGLASLIEYDNVKNYAITQNPDGDDDFANTYSRLVWLEPKDDSFYYCTVDFKLETLDDARKTKAQADASDPESGGCGESNFSWTKLTRVE